MELVVLHKFKKWFNKFERYKVTYKNGGYHLANLFQSPPVGRSVRGYDQPFCLFSHATLNMGLISTITFIFKR